MNDLCFAESRHDFVDEMHTFEAKCENMLQILDETHEVLLECNAMLLANIKHLDVPYDRPPIGFTKE